MIHLTPPLIAMMAGAAARARKERPPVQITLHFPVAKFLRENCLPFWDWTHFPADEMRDMRTATRLIQRGFHRWWGDFILLSPRGLAHFLMLPNPGEPLTFEQDEFRIRCIARGNPCEVCWTIDQALLAFERWECLRGQIEPRRAPAHKL